MNTKKSRSTMNLKLMDPNWPQMDVNELFIEACSNGDYQSVNLIINTIKDFNTDITDNLGRTALRLAVANEHIEVVQALLNISDNQKIREALLLSIHMGHSRITEFILRHPLFKVFSEKKFLNGASDSFWQTPSSDDAQFSPDITPIMLAAHYNRTEIVQMLLANGDRIEKPHEYNCDCNDCSNRFEFDSLRNAQSRLNAYKGLASEVYISLASIDPILTSFELRHEIVFLADKEKHFKGDYLKMAKNLSEYVCKLMNNVRGRDELEIVLNKIGKENEEKFEQLARIDLALKYQEMEFVAHPNCQQKLDEIWNSGIRKITKMNPLIAGLLYIAFIFFIPLGSIIYVLLPKSKLGRFMSLPFVKFFSFTISYFAFICMLVASSLQFIKDEQSRNKLSVQFNKYFINYTNYRKNLKLTYRFPTSDMYIRSDYPNQIDFIICIWITGLCLRELRKILTYGIRDYLFSWSNILPTVTHFLFIVSYALKYYTMTRVRMEKNKLIDPNFWYLVSHLENNITQQENVYETFYWLNEDRYFWYSLDPIHLSEGIFAVAIVLSFSRLMLWLSANQNLGPLQITFGAMISDILKFICIFTIVFSGFLVGLYSLYWYYRHEVRNTVEITIHAFETKGENYFGTIGSALITMFFALYTIGSGDDVQLEPFENNLTTTFGSFLFGSFHIINISILFSMLIAMLTKSFDSILEHSDIQWKFSRTKLYMEYIKEASVLPIPLNIIPTPALMFAYIKKMCVSQKAKRKQSQIMKQTKTRSQQRNQNSMSNYSGYRKKYEDELTFKKVMERVAKRFLLHNHREKENVKESDFDELKQDVQIVRFEMMNDIALINENLLRYSRILHSGMSLIGEYFLKDHQVLYHKTAKRFQKFQKSGTKCDSDLQEQEEIILANRK